MDMSNFAPQIKITIYETEYTNNAGSTACHVNWQYRAEQDFR